jgi:hypothetical protein
MTNIHTGVTGDAMRILYMGIDAHKESNLVALAFAERQDPELHGKVPADVPGFIEVPRKIMDKHGIG